MISLYSFILNWFILPDQELESSRALTLAKVELAWNRD